MTPNQAGSLMKRARKLLRAGELTHHQLVLLDCLVWSCRAPGSDRLTVSYTRLQRLAHVARDTVARGVRRLEVLGLLVKQRRRVRVSWGGGIASRQATNGYVLRTESGRQPVYREASFLPTVVRAVKEKTALEDALSRLGRAVIGRRRPAAACAAC